MGWFAQRHGQRFATEIWKRCLPAALGFVVLCAMLASAAPAVAKVFHSKEGALELAFPAADEVKRRHFFLTEAQLQAIERLGGERPSSKLLTVYEGRKKGKLLGYAVVDTHIVRTLPETFMTVIGADGRVSAVHILAFYEPLEYLPPERWLAQFRRRRLSADLAVRQQIAGIAGSTLSAHAVTRGTRRVLALFEVVVKPRAMASRARPADRVNVVTR